MALPSAGQPPPVGIQGEPPRRQLPDRAPPLIIIAGATATGKTDLAIRLSEVISGGEVISADSRQVYRGLDIGTAKASAADRARVPHHGLDLVDPDASFTLADYVAHAHQALWGIAQRGGVAVLAGGTGLYLRAIARGIALDSIPADAALRAGIERDLAAGGLPALLARLDRLAPTFGSRIDRRNPRRVTRALEIAEIQGDRSLPEPRGYPGPSLWLGLSVQPAAHRAWIAKRAQAQFDAGLLTEAAGLLARYPPTLRSLSGIGYPEAFAVLEGRLTLEAAIALDIRRNNLFAKRQGTWFRREPDVQWFDATSADPLAWAKQLATGMLGRFSSDPHG